MRLVDREMFEIDVEKTLKSRLLLKTLIFSGILGLIGLTLLGIFTYRSATNGFMALSTDKLEIISEELNDNINSLSANELDSNKKLRLKVNKMQEKYFKYNTGKIYVLDQKGNFVIGEASNSEKENMDFLSNIKGSNTGQFKYETNGTGRLAVYKHASNSGSYVVVSDQINNLTRFKKNVAWTMIITCIVAMVLMGIGAVFVTNNITGPINKLVEVLKKTEKGDLTVEVDFDNRDDELGVLGTHFNNMVNKQAGMIDQVKEAVQTVTSSSEELSATIDETSQYIENTTSSVTELSAGIQQISSNAQTVSSSSQEMSGIVEDGDQAIEEAINEMHVIRTTVEESAEVIKELGAKSQEIGDIIELITDIAEQTNLLALNAAIEAARAGEHGRGFAVVAEEIQDLAEETTNAADNIAQLIKETQDESQEAIESIERGTKEVAEGEQVIEKAGDAFKEIKEDIGETTRQIEDTSAATQEMAAGADEVVNSTENIDDMSKEVNETSESLAKEANKLKELINKFRV